MYRWPCRCCPQAPLPAHRTGRINRRVAPDHSAGLSTALQPIFSGMIAQNRANFPAARFRLRNHSNARPRYGCRPSRCSESSPRHLRQIAHRWSRHVVIMRHLHRVQTARSSSVPWSCRQTSPLPTIALPRMYAQWRISAPSSMMVGPAMNALGAMVAMQYTNTPGNGWPKSLRIDDFVEP